MTAMSNVYDAIIIGGGHNGLTCATYLAQSGKTVLVLEASEHLGGAATTRPFANGFSSSCAHILHLLNPDVIKDLKLKHHGFKLAAKNISTVALAENGNHLVINGNRLDGPISVEDQQEFRIFNKRMHKFANILGYMFKKRPPRLGTKDFTDNWTMARAAMKVRLMGRADMQDFIRIAAINIYDVLEEHFENELLKGALSFDAVLGTHMGPRSPNSVFTYLYRLSGNVAGKQAALAIPRGGMGSVTQALAESAASAGVEIRRNAAVKRIQLENGKVTGVLLEDGENIDSQTVASSTDPKRTMLELVGAENLETGFARRIHNIRMRGSVAKLDIGLDSLPTFSGLDDSHLGCRLLIAPTMTYVDRAFDKSKYGDYSDKPALEITIPTIHDDSLAPAGKHVLSALVQYAPYELRQGWDIARDDFTKTVIDLLDEYSPGLCDRIADIHMQTPVDIEREYKLTGGHWHHGEAALDQMLMMRPVPGAAQYGTPIPGLYLCGAGCHPGGGVMGLPGRNAARAIISQGGAA